MQFNQREILAVDNPEYFTCINWKPLGDRQRYEYPSKQEAITKGKNIVKQDDKAKIMDNFIIKNKSNFNTQDLKLSSKLRLNLKLCVNKSL